VGLFVVVINKVLDRDKIHIIYMHCGQKSELAWNAKSAQTQWVPEQLKRIPN